MTTSTDEAAAAAAPPIVVTAEGASQREQVATALSRWAGMASQEWETAKAGLISSGEWLAPSFGDQNCDATALEGRTIFVEGVGAGAIVKRIRHVLGSNTVLVRFEHETKETFIARKGNRGVRWLIAAAQSSSAGGIDEEVRLLTSEYERMCSTSYRRLSISPLFYDPIPTDPQQAKVFLTAKIATMRIGRKQQATIIPVVAVVSAGPISLTALGVGCGALVGAIVADAQYAKSQASDVDAPEVVQEPRLQKLLAREAELVSIPESKDDALSTEEEEVHQLEVPLVHASEVTA